MSLVASVKSRPQFIRKDSARTFWCHLVPQGRPCVSPGVLRDLTEMQADVARWLAQAGEKRPFDYFVVASGIPGIFNMGGDLKLFAEAVRKEQRVLLRQVRVLPRVPGLRVRRRRRR